jgi:hypothetical protein
MEEPQGTGYAEIAEVRTVTGAAACNQLLADGWMLFGGLSPDNSCRNDTRGSE